MNEERNYKVGPLTPNQLPGPLHIRVQRDIGREGYSLYLLCYEPVASKPGTYRRWVVGNITLVEMPETGWLPYEPSLFLDGCGFGQKVPPAVQDLMDELWRLGIRPAGEPVHDPSHTHDLRVHLQDLREIVSKVLPSALRENPTPCSLPDGHEGHCQP